MKNSMKHVALAAILAPLTIYIVTYCILSAMGDYYFTQSGKIRYSGAFAVSDIEMWEPKLLWFQPGFVSVDGSIKSRGNTLGYIFSPLIVIDRKLFHKTKNVFD